MPFMGRQHICQALQAGGDSLLVFQLDTNAQALAMELLGPRQVSSFKGEASEVVEYHGHGITVPQLAENGEALVEKLCCPLILSLVDGHFPQVVQGCRDPPRIARLALQSQALAV